MQTKLFENRKHFNHISKNIEIDLLEQVNTETGRYYKTPTGTLYPSVTTVTGIMNLEAIKQWRTRVGDAEANRISTQATRRGTRVHKLCEDYLNNDVINPSDYTVVDLDNFRSFREIIDQHIDNIHLQEQRLYSDHLALAGTVDCVAEYAGRLSIIDFKTARKAKNRDFITNYFCQATAYAIMYEERTGIPVPNIVIMISVDDDFPQIFTSKRDYHVKELIDARQKYKQIYGI